jgi:hypothetical protein
MKIGSRAACSLIAIIALAGCESTTGERTSTQRGALLRAQSCSELEQLLKEDARTKMNARIDAQIQQTERLGEGPLPYGAAKNGAVPSPGSASSDPSSRAREYSQTNTQIQGVDEADIVKTDGKYIYLLHGPSFVVLDAWPAANLAEASSFALEGMPVEMFVRDSTAVIYSIVEGTPIYAAAGIAPRAEYSDGYAYAAVTPAVGGYPGPGYYRPNPLTKVTVLRITDAHPALARELYFEGSYVSSRRVDGHVRTVLQGGAHGPDLAYWPESTTDAALPATKEEWVEAFEALRRKNAAAIDASVAADWLPYVMARQANGVSAAQMPCGDFYVPTAGSTEYGLTTVASIDLGAPDDPPRTAGILAQVDTVFATEGAMYLAARAWDSPAVLVMASNGTSGSGSGGTGGADGGTPTPPPPQDAGSAAQSLRPSADGIGVGDRVTINFTYVHKFDLAVDPSTPTYVASGTVPGNVVNQYSFDEDGEALRVTTTELQTTTDHWETTQTNHLFILGVDGQALVVRGHVGDLAPGERVYSTRFVGDYAYVVTFKQVDPLFVVDLHDPTAPRVVGELTIPGFSSYMHPLDDGHLLTIGQEDRKLSLEVFDVREPTAPALAHKFVFSGDEYGYSQAQYDPKAFTYFAALELLAFPFTAWGQTGMRSSLELFHVDPASGITRLGSVDHSAFFANAPHGYCGGFYGPEVRRGLFLEDVVYSISYGGVVANDVHDLGRPIKALSLPAPEGSASYPICAPVGKAAETQ